jgi:SNF2 family DNA or RNA helicase
MPYLSIEGGNTIVVEDCYDQRKIVSDIGGHWDFISKVWNVTFTLYNLRFLLNHMDGLSLADDVGERIKEQEDKEVKLARLHDMSKTDIPIRLRVPGLNVSPYNYQRYGIMFAVTNGSGILNADEMGLGKTIQAIATAIYLKDRGLAKNALCITPASLKFNWPIEIEKFTNEKYVVIDGSPDERIAQWLRDDVFFYVVNYELILEDLFGGRDHEPKKGDKPEAIARKKKLKSAAEKRERILGPIRRRIWGFIVCDECHAIRNSSSKRAQNVKLLRSRFRMGLTGTPIDGRLEEMHGIMDWIAPGLLGSRTRFFQRHIKTDFYGKVTGYKRIDEVRERIQPFFIRRLKQQVLHDLPDKIYENRVVLLSPEGRKIYDALAKGGHEATEDAQAIVAAIRCKQFCDYPALVDDTCKRSSKLDALRDVLEEVAVQNSNKAIMFTQYKTVLDFLVSLLEDMGLQYLRIDGDTPKKVRAEMQAVFRDDPSIDMMIGTDAMSTGLNLQAASYVINYDDFWSPSIMDQRADRCHRIGQKEVVTVVSFICRNTIEERIRSVIRQKSRVTAEVLGDDLEEMVLQRLGPKEIAKLL